MVFGGLLWFDYLGLLDIKDTLAPVLSLVTGRRRTQVEDVEAGPALLEDQRVAKQWEAIDIMTEELDKREADLALEEQEVLEMMETLQEREKALEEREKSFNTQVNLYENKKANIMQNARYLTGMPPENAVDILINMEDQDAIDHLRAAEELAQQAGEASIVAFWLSLIAGRDAERAAQLQRKMALKPTDF
jgi:flagellar protein FlbB